MRGIERIDFRVNVTNTGRRAGDCVVLGFVQRADRAPTDPIRKLFGFERVHLAAGETKTVWITAPPEVLAHVSQHGRQQLLPGRYVARIGDASSSVQVPFQLSGSAQVLFDLPQIRARYAAAQRNRSSG